MPVNAARVRNAPGPVADGLLADWGRLSLGGGELLSKHSLRLSDELVWLSRLSPAKPPKRKVGIWFSVAVLARPGAPHVEWPLVRVSDGRRGAAFLRLEFRLAMTGPQKIEFARLHCTSHVLHDGQRPREIQKAMTGNGCRRIEHHLVVIILSFFGQGCDGCG